MEKMNGNDNKRKFEEAPASLKSAVWDHFGFSVECDDQGKKTVDKQRTVCKHCFSSFVYSSGSTSNMAGHLRRSHPTINVSGTARKDLGSSSKTIQTSISSAFQQKYPVDSDRQYHQSSKPRRPLSLTCYTQCTMFSNAFRGTFIAQKSLASCLIAVN